MALTLFTCYVEQLTVAKLSLPTTTLRQVDPSERCSRLSTELPVNSVTAITDSTCEASFNYT